MKIELTTKFTPLPSMEQTDGEILKITNFFYFLFFSIFVNETLSFIFTVTKEIDSIVKIQIKDEIIAHLSKSERQRGEEIVLMNV